MMEGKQPLLNMHEFRREGTADFKSASELKKKEKLVRFTRPVQKFVGPELEEYGPFQEEDITKLPVEIVDILISRGDAEEIEED